MIQQFQQLRARLRGMIARGVVRVVTEAAKTQRLQVTIRADDVQDDVEHFQGYGMSFHAPVGSECLVLAPGASRTNAVAICVQHPDQRPQDAAEGEGGLYNANGWLVYIDANGVAHLGAKAGEAGIPRDDRIQTELGRVKDDLATIKTLLLTDWAPVAQDGGAALKAAAVNSLAAFPSDPGATACDNVKGT